MHATTEMFYDYAKCYILDKKQKQNKDGRKSRFSMLPSWSVLELEDKEFSGSMMSGQNLK
jgi:hypothetical protein